MVQVNAFLNGTFLPVEQACLNIEDRGTLFGDGIYEFIRVLDGRLFQMAEHMFRLRRSAAEITLSVPYNDEQITDVCKELIRQSGVSNAGLYIQITRGSAARNHLFPVDCKPNFFMVARELTPYPASLYIQGVSLVLLPDERWKRCDIKTLNLLANVLAKEKAKKERYWDAILYCDKGITESTSSSVFAVSNGTIITTPPGPWVLPGITAQTVIALARDSGMSVEERFITPDEIYGADEVMITSTRIGIIPVVRVNAKLISDGKPGNVYRLLHESLTAYLSQGKNLT